MASPFRDSLTHADTRAAHTPTSHTQTHAQLSLLRSCCLNSLTFSDGGRCVARSCGRAACLGGFTPGGRVGDGSRQNEGLFVSAVLW